MNSSVDLQQDITAGDTEDSLESGKTELTVAAKRIAYLESKTEGLENRGQRKNLRSVGLPKNPGKTRPTTDFTQHMLPIWKSATHSGKTKTGDQSRAVIISFLLFQDRKVFFNTSKQRFIFFPFLVPVTDWKERNLRLPILCSRFIRGNHEGTDPIQRSDLAIML